MEKETRTVTLTTPDGDTREVTIWRYSPKHCWFTEDLVLVMRPTGYKQHKMTAQVVEHNGKWGFPYQTVLNRNTGRVIAWATPKEEKIR